MFNAHTIALKINISKTNDVNTPGSRVGPHDHDWMLAANIRKKHSESETENPALFSDNNYRKHENLFSDQLTSYCF